MSQKPRYDAQGIVCPLYNAVCCRKECSDSDVCQRSRSEIRTCSVCGDVHDEPTVPAKESGQ